MKQSTEPCKGNLRLLTSQRSHGNIARSLNNMRCCTCALYLNIDQRCESWLAHRLQSNLTTCLKRSWSSTHLRARKQTLLKVSLCISLILFSRASDELFSWKKRRLQQTLELSKLLQSTAPTPESHRLLLHPGPPGGNRFGERSSELCFGLCHEAQWLIA